MASSRKLLFPRYIFAYSALFSFAVLLLTPRFNPLPRDIFTTLIKILSFDFLFQLLSLLFLFYIAARAGYFVIYSRDPGHPYDLFLSKAIWPAFGLLFLAVIMLLTDDDVIFVHGGYSDNTYYDDTWYFYIETSTWLRKET